MHSCGSVGRRPPLGRYFVLVLAAGLGCGSVAAQPMDPPPPPPGDGPRGPGGPGRGPMQGERKVVERFDRDGDGRLNAGERATAREELKREASERGGGRGPGGFGPPGGMRGMGMGGDEKPSPGPRVSKSEVSPARGGLYDTGVLRTIFLDFDAADWEDELSDFIRTDVEVPATLTVDGKAYPGVGVSFRGASSLMMVGKGSKRSLNISTDFMDGDQRVMGYRTLNLLNGHADPSFMHTVLYFEVARGIGVPAPMANHVRLVINGESWGVYVNAQQFNRDMLAELFPETKGEGARWKAPGSPNGRSGLEYLGDDIAPYRGRYTIKTRDDEASWRALIDLCRTVDQTPPEQLEEALKGKLDVDGALKFLALENALINSDGYWIRSSDYCLYLDTRGEFHILPHDANETFAPGGGPGGRGGPRPPPGDMPPARADAPQGPPPREGGPDRQPRGPGGPDQRGGRGVAVDPLIGLDDTTKPLRNKLLAVPALRERYLAHVRTIAEQWLDWGRLGPIVERTRALIDAELKADTKKLSSYDAFVRAVSGDAARVAGEPPPGGRGQGMPLKAFADHRRAYLLGHEAVRTSGR